MAEVRQGGVTAMQYAYNSKGERVRRYIGTDDTYSTYDEAGRWLGDEHLTPNTETSQSVIWLDDLPIAVLWNLRPGPDPDPGLGDPDPPIGSRSTVSPLTIVQDELYYIEPDHLGTPRAVIDPLRDVAVWTWDLWSEAFGNSPPNQDPDGDGTSFVFDMRFPGQRYDAASGLNYNYFREYEPGTGRYSQSDPIGLAGGISTYGYVNASPSQLIDPYGLEGVGSWTSPPPPDPAYNLAWAALRSTYREILNKNVRGTDQYFHCLAACRATKNSGNPKIVLEIMNRKEYRDYILNIFGRYGERRLSHSDMLVDMAKDRSVNELGAACPPEVDCESRCSSLLDNLPETHRKFMLDYRSDWREKP